MSTLLVCRGQDGPSTQDPYFFSQSLLSPAIASVRVELDGVLHSHVKCDLHA